MWKEETSQMYTSNKIHKFNNVSSHTSNNTHGYPKPGNEIVTSLAYKNR